MKRSNENQFKFSTSTIAYLAAVVILAVTLLVTSPLATTVLAAVAVVALLVVWFKAGIRNGRWVWLDPRAALTQGEGAVWLSAIAMFIPVIALLVLASGMAHLHGAEFRTTELGAIPFPGERAVHHSDTDAKIEAEGMLSVQRSA